MEGCRREREQDGLQLCRVPPGMTAEQLLAKTGLFLLKDIDTPLGLKRATVIKRARLILARGQSPQKIMGLRKILSYWAVNMGVFAGYYREYLVPLNAIAKIPIRPLPEKGTLPLCSICLALSLPVAEVRQQVLRSALGRKTIKKDPYSGRYLADLERLLPWLRKNRPDLAYLEGAFWDQAPTC